MIKEVWLFTNRSLICFDEKGEQVINVQSNIGWEVEWYRHEKNEVTALEKIIKDNPVVYLARWQDWKHDINLDELCSILGHGKWYWDYKNKETNENYEKE